MFRAALCCLCSLVPLAALQAADAKATPAKPATPLEGTWKLLSSEREERVRPFTDRQPRWVFKGDKVYYGGEELAGLTLDLTAMPHCIDLAFRRPAVTYEGIFAVDGKTLKICLNRNTVGARERPQEFVTKDRPTWRILVFEREDSGNELEGVIPYLGMQLRRDKARGIVVAATDEGGHAERAGLRTGDQILKVGGVEATDLAVVLDATLRSKPGSELTVTLKRDEQTREVKLRVGVLMFRVP